MWQAHACSPYSHLLAVLAQGSQDQCSFSLHLPQRCGLGWGRIPLLSLLLIGQWTEGFLSLVVNTNKSNDDDNILVYALPPIQEKTTPSPCHHNGKMGFYFGVTQKDGNAHFLSLEVEQLREIFSKVHRRNFTLVWLDSSRNSINVLFINREEKTWCTWIFSGKW